jgi:hypothetical protein
LLRVRAPFLVATRCLSLIPAVVASFAIMTSFLASFWCQTIKFNPTSDSGVSDGAALQFGPWYQNSVQQSTVVVGGETKIFINNVCVLFPSGTYVDPKLKAARAFTVIAGVVGGMMTVGLWLAPCAYGRAAANWKCYAVTLMTFVTAFQGLTFLVYPSSLCTDNPVIAMMGWEDSFESECAWDQGTTCNVVSTVLWFLTGVCMLVQGPPQRPPPEPVETQAVTYQRTANPDGTSTVAEVAVVKGVAVPSSGGKSPPEGGNTAKLAEP